MYAPFLGLGSLAFDIGAHVGDRSRCFRRLGARVVAVEPQPRMASFLAWLFQGDTATTLLPLAVAARPGRVELMVNVANPTLSTGSASFRLAVANAPAFAGEQWGERTEVEATTLDLLIERYGPPDFIKIDVEGMEDEVLAGLSRPVPALSFEFVPAHAAAASRALARLRALGSYRYNVSMGESMGFLLDTWCDGEAMAQWLAARPVDGPSGDIYARAEDPA